MTTDDNNPDWDDSEWEDDDWIPFLRFVVAIAVTVVLAGIFAIAFVVL